MTPSHFGGAKKHLDCGPRPTRFASWNRPETVERASIEARSEAPESHRRVKGNKSGSPQGRDASSARRMSRLFVGGCVPCQRASLEVGNAAAWTADLGLLLRDYGT